MSFHGSLFHAVLIFLFTFLQTNLLNRVAGLTVTPDIAFILLIFSSYKQGKLKGQLTGFSSGLLMDFLSLSPLGFNALIRTVVGYLFGAIKGKLFVDPVFVPLVMVIAASVIREALSSILTGIFTPSGEYIFFARNFFLELGINVFLAPFILGILQFFKVLSINEKDSY